MDQNRQLYVEIEDSKCKIKSEFDVDLGEEISGLVCQFCPAVIPSDYYMQEHLDNKHPLDFQCRHCELKFRGSQILNDHIANHHRDMQSNDIHTDFHSQLEIQPIILPLSSTEVKNDIKLNQAITVKTRSKGAADEVEPLQTRKTQKTRKVRPLPKNTSVTCCGRRFFTKHTLQAHFKKRHSKDFECDVCKQLFNNRNYIFQHMTKHFYAEKCTICNTKFVQTKYFKKHILTCKQQLCLECGIKFKTETGLQHHKKLKHPKTKYLCRYCGCYCHSQSALIVHERLHTGDLPINCDFCQKRYASRSQILGHMKIHLRHTDYPCNICNKKFDDKEKLKRHIRRTHDPNNKNIACKFCDKKFRRTDDLKVHSVVHTGFKQFRCDICNIEFAHKPSLTRHNKSKHSNEPEKRKFMYLCSTCGVGFDSPNKLKHHSFTHKNEIPFKCDICDQGFNSPGSLISHKYIKHKILPHECPKCEMRFRLKSEMMNHLTEH